MVFGYTCKHAFYVEGGLIANCALAGRVHITPWVHLPIYGDRGKSYGKYSDTKQGYYAIYSEYFRNRINKPFLAVCEIINKSNKLHYAN